MLCTSTAMELAPAVETLAVLETLTLPPLREPEPLAPMVTLPLTVPRRPPPPPMLWT